MKKRNPSRFYPGTIHKTKSCGSIIVVRYTNSRDVDIRFVDTGFECKTTSPKITSGSIKDKLRPSVCGVGFLGDLIFKQYEIGTNRQTPAYKSWASMISRCYSDVYHKKQPTYVSCEVCEEWQNFSLFADWFYENHPSDGKEYELDKDSLIPGNKLYSPDTCKFVTKLENTIVSNKARLKVSLKSPLGDTHCVGNIPEFCSINGLEPKSIYDLTYGGRKSHKGWTLAK